MYVNDKFVVYNPDTVTVVEAGARLSAATMSS